MTLNIVTNYSDKKVEENEYFIKFTYFELSVKNNLSSDEIDEFLGICKNYFENKEYKLFFPNETYEYNGNLIKVKSNELMIAIKEEKERKISWIQKLLNKVLKV